jgi:hypothetical protein
MCPSFVIFKSWNSFSDFNSKNASPLMSCSLKIVAYSLNFGMVVSKNLETSSVFQCKTSVYVSLLIIVSFVISMDCEMDCGIDEMDGFVLFMGGSGTIVDIEVFSGMGTAEGSSNLRFS